ncbi:hypothetical protein [Loigolactobacillus bifermentans]|uniref:Uncharacterized protein n=2 Tax=Loigolactobacillus bifermentans TaxID=1607 RepID=A0A0R1GKH0_9LACO|nr:hypothetical protein [Loigolactobacillus bifermentans]KRK34507.1 hypothetical protein FC07_GL000517 [Loigolactobacillus bifermentans DSM 20003]
MEAGLVKQSYVDVHRQIVLKTATVIQRQPIGKLSIYDAAQLLAFIKAHTEAILKIRQDDQRQFGV